MGQRSYSIATRSSIVVVRDLSPRGARLLVASPIGIPEQFDLRIDRTGVCHPSKVAWRKADKIGVVFLTGDGL